MYKASVLSIVESDPKSQCRVYQKQEKYHRESILLIETTRKCGIVMLSSRRSVVRSMNHEQGRMKEVKMRGMNDSLESDILETRCGML